MAGDHNPEDVERKAEAWMERIAGEALDADPDANPELIAILADEEAPEHFRRYFAKKAIASDVDLLWRFAKRFGPAAMEAAVEAMEDTDRKMVDRIFKAMLRAHDEGGS